MPAAREDAFDAAGDRYDDDERANAAFRHIRERSYARLEATFSPAARLLEVGSGTGTEAARLAARGATLVLSDVAPGMLARARAKVEAARAGAVAGAHLLPARRIGEVTGTYGRAAFDGAYSSLGPLNCEHDLVPVARGLAELVAPGGALVLSVMNRWCAVEAAWFAARGRWGEAARRWGGPVRATAVEGGPRDVTTWYHARGEIERAFGAWFRPEHAEALPLLWPPTNLDVLVRRWGRMFAALAPVERRAARWPVLRDLGDHVLVVLRRRRP